MQVLLFCQRFSN